MDAGVKILSAGALASASLWTGRWEAQAAFVALLGALFALARLPRRLLWQAGRSAAWLLLFVAVANGAWALVVRQAEWAGGEATVARTSELGSLVLRLFTLLLLAVLFTSTTVPVDAAEALERLLRPLRRLRLPVHELGMLLVLSLSFIPIFWREARSLSDAHRMKRGIARWRRRDRLRAVIPLVVPLFLGVLRRADELAVALDSRGFVPGAERTSIVPVRFAAPEALALAVALAAAVAAAAWR